MADITKGAGSDRLEQERRRVARIAQEVVENRRELAEILYVWDMRMVAGPSCAIMPGDYVAVGSGCMCSSRGAMVDMDADDILALVTGGGMHRALDMDDLNAPDLDIRINSIMERVEAQRMYKDADRYLCSHDLRHAVAEYDPDPVPGSEAPPAQFAVERRGDRFSYRNGARGGDVPMRECRYEEFNPGGAEIVLAAQAEARPEEGRAAGSAYAEMLRRYERSGGHGAEMPSDAARRIPGFEDMSPREQMAAKYKLMDEYHKAAERSAAQERSPDAADQWGPRLPGESRY